MFRTDRCHRAPPSKDTTVRQQISLKGQKAVELLLKHIEDPALTKQEEILPLQLVERESVRTI